MARRDGVASGEALVEDGVEDARIAGGAGCAKEPNRSGGSHLNDWRMSRVSPVQLPKEPELLEMRGPATEKWAADEGRTP